MQSKNHSALTNSMDFYFERAGGAAVAVTGRVKKIRPSSGRAGGAAVAGRVKNPLLERARGRCSGCTAR